MKDCGLAEWIIDDSRLVDFPFKQVSLLFDPPGPRADQVVIEFTCGIWDLVGH